SQHQGTLCRVLALDTAIGLFDEMCRGSHQLRDLRRRKAGHEAIRSITMPKLRGDQPFRPEILEWDSRLDRLRPEAPEFVSHLLGTAPRLALFGDGFPAASGIVPEHMGEHELGMAL